MLATVYWLLSTAFNSSFRIPHSSFQPVELRGVVVHDHARQLRRARARDLAVAHHACEGDGERLAPRLVREPADLLPPDFGREDECVRAEHNFFWGGFEPAAQGRAERARGAQEGLRGEVRVDVRLQQKRRRLIREGPAAVYEHEVGLAECGVVEDEFEHHGVAARDAVVAADARARVYVNGQPQATGLARDVAEEKILERLVLGGCGRSRRRSRAGAGTRPRT